MTVTVRTCRVCGLTKELDDFPRRRSRTNTPGWHYATRCKDCYNDYQRIKGARHRERHPTRNAERKRLDLSRAKQACLEHYGFECVCCGNDYVPHLTVDHINGGGTQHRKEVKHTMWRWLRKNDFPEGYQIMCFNCNFAKYLLGECCCVTRETSHEDDSTQTEQAPARCKG